MSVEFGNDFGNYMVQGIEEIYFPAAVSWWPVAPGWKVLAIVLMLLLARMAMTRYRRWRRNAYRRVALARLETLKHDPARSTDRLVAELPLLLKATALRAYPRSEVAGLSGEAWLAFLGAHCKEAAFEGDLGRKLLRVAYGPREQWQLDDEDSRRLTELCATWIKNHGRERPDA